MKIEWPFVVGVKLVHISPTPGQYGAPPTPGTVTMFSVRRIEDEEKI